MLFGLLNVRLNPEALLSLVSFRDKVCSLVCLMTVLVMIQEEEAARDEGNGTEVA